MNNKTYEQQDMRETVKPFTHYKQALDYLQDLAKFGINPGLERIVALLDLMGNPQRQARFIHIGGTNGKGSTLAVMEALLQRLGRRTGCFISPHLHNWRERIHWEKKLITEEDVLRGINRIRPLAQSLAACGLEYPTEFEVSTALAFWFFAEKNPDIVLLEVGMGGAIDSTNVIDPEVVVLTNIGVDHTDYLGTTLTQITGVKAGIIKSRIPVVTSAQQDEALRVITDTCQRKNAPLIRVNVKEETQFSPQDHSVVYAVPSPGKTPEYSSCFDYHGVTLTISDCEVSLAGCHQIQNAATALAAVEVFLQREQQREAACEKVSLQELRQGLLEVSWPGRMELISCLLSDKTIRILFDGAHNADGMEALRQALERGYPRRRLIFCFGMLADKAIEKSLERLLPLGDAFIVTRPPSIRAGNLKNTVAMIQAAGSLCIEEEDVKEAMHKAMELCDEEDLLCVTGSLYMLAEARSLVLNL